MAYDAGAIEARMTIDRSAFQRGLKESRAEAAEFEKGGTRRERVEVTGIEQAKARLNELRQRVTANVGVNTAESRAEISALERELRKLQRKVEARVGLKGVPETLVEIEAVKHELEKLDRERVSPKVDPSGLSRLEGAARRAQGGMSGLTLAALTLAPAVATVGAVAAGGAVALGGMFTAAAAGAGAFALVAIPTFKQIFKQTQAVHKAQLAYNNAVTDKQRQAALLKEKQAWAAMTPAQRQAGHALLAFKATFESFRKSLEKPVLQVFTGGLNLAKQILPSLRPLVMAASHAFVGLERGASRALAGPFWQKFIHFLSGQAGPALTTFGRVLGNIAHGFAGLFMAFKPILGPMERGLVSLTAKFAHFGATAGSSKGVQHFIAYLRTNGPLVIRTLGDLAKAAVEIGKAFAATGPATLQLIGTIARMVTGFARANPELLKLIAQFVVFGALARRLLSPILGVAAAALKAGKHLKGLAKEGGALRTVFAVLRGPIGIAVAAIGAVVGAAIYAYKHFKPFRDTVQQVGRMFSSVLGPAVRQAAAWIKQHLGSAISWVKAHWPEISKAIVSVMTFIARTVKDVLGAIKTFWETYGGSIKRIAKGVWEAIKGIVTGAMKIIKGVIDIVLGLIHGNWGRVWKGVKEIAHGVWEAIKGIVKGAIHFVLGIISGVLKTIGLVFKAGWDLLKKIVSAAWDWIKKAVSDGISSVLKFIGDLPGKIVKALGDLGKLLLQAGKDIIQGLIDGVVSMAKAVVKAVKDTVGGLVDGAKSLLGIHSPSRVFHEMGMHMMKGLENGMRAGGPGTIGALSAVVDGLQAQMSDPLRMRLAVGAGASLGGQSIAGGRVGGALAAAPSIDRSTHQYDIHVPPVIAGQNGFDVAHASAQLGRAMVQHGRAR